MILCKVECPSCGTAHDVPLDSLKEASMLTCNVCENDIALSTENESKAKSKPRKTQKNMKFGNPPAKKRTARKPAAKRRKSSSISTKYIVNVCIIGLVLILVTVAGFKLFGSKGQKDLTEAKQAEVNAAVQEIKTNNMVKAEMAALKKQLLDANNKKSASKQSPAEKETIVLAGYEKNNSNGLEVQEVETVTVDFVKPDEIESEEPVVKVEEAKKPKMKTKNEASPTANVPTSTSSGKMILSESDQRELDELMKVPSYELTLEEENTLKELKAKYAWFKANRFKMTRDELEYEWDRRWAAIDSSNKMAKSRSDAMLPRPLQILLAEAKTQKDRAYLMRIYQRPVSFEEKELVRKARNQAIWERRKADGPMRYPEDRKKKRNQKYVDEYGYEYYLDENGQRVYL